MKIIAFNGSPRKNGNTTQIVQAILEGAGEMGAETVEVRLHDLNVKGCQGCYGCKKNPGVCSLNDELTPFLHGIKDCSGIVVASPIYMYRLAAQMKVLVDRLYSYYMYKQNGPGYDSMVPPGKTFALVTSQGAPDPEQYHKSLRWLAGMAGAGLGMKEVGRIIHTNSQASPAGDDAALMASAREIGRKMVSA